MLDKNGKPVITMHGVTIEKSIHPFKIYFKEWKNYKGFSLYRIHKLTETLEFLSCVRYNTRETENPKIVDDSLLKSQIAHELKCTDFKFKYRFDFA